MYDDECEGSATAGAPCSGASYPRLRRRLETVQHAVRWHETERHPV